MLWSESLTARERNGRLEVEELLPLRLRVIAFHRVETQRREGATAGSKAREFCLCAFASLRFHRVETQRREGARAGSKAREFCLCAFASLRSNLAGCLEAPEEVAEPADRVLRLRQERLERLPDVKHVVIRVDRYLDPGAAGGRGETQRVVEQDLGRADLE